MKGQAHSFDFTFAILVFLVLTSFLYIYYSNTIIDYSEKLSRTRIETHMSKTIETLTRTPGIPENWENINQTPITIGLSSGNNNILDNGKVEAFFNLTYDQIKQVWGISDHDFSLRFSGQSIGIEPNNGTEFVVFLQRMVYYNETGQNITVEVWK